MTAPHSDHDAPDASQEDALAVVHRELTGIYGSIAESLRDDPEIIPWTLRELRGILSYIQSVKKECGSQAERVDRAS
jgi:hypothetical protein